MPASAKSSSPYAAANHAASVGVVMGALGCILSIFPEWGLLLAAAGIICSVRDLGKSRALKRGASLAVIGVLFGTLGMLASLYCIWPKIIPYRSAWQDGRQLERFVRELEEIPPHKWAEIEAIPPQPTAARLFWELYHREIITAEQFGLLAGISGTRPTDAELMNGEIDASEHVIFTGPRDGKTLMRMMRHGHGKEGVLFCYNKHFYNQFPDDGMVVMFPSSTREVRALYPWGIRKIYNDANPHAPVTLEGTLDDLGGDFYGNAPFQHVAPE